MTRTPVFTRSVWAIAVACICCAGAADAASPQLRYVITKPFRYFYSIASCRVTHSQMTANCSLKWTNFDSQYASDQTASLEGRALPDATPDTHVLMLIGGNSAAMPNMAPPQPLPDDVVQARLDAAMRSLYPRSATTQNARVSVSAECTIADDGSLDNCWLGQDMPGGVEFGYATLKLVDLIRIAAPLPAQRSQTFAFDWHLPGPPDLVFVNCLVTSERKSSDCKVNPDSDDPDAQVGDNASVLAQLAAHPLRLRGIPGEHFDLTVLRSELGKTQTVGGHFSQGAAERPARATALTSELVGYYYPEMSIRLNEQGTSAVECKVTDDGRLNECMVWTTSGHERLDHALLELTEAIRMKPPTDRAPVYDNRMYRFAVNWTLQ